MKKILFTAGVALFAALSVSCGSKTAPKAVKGDASTCDTLSYALGIDISNSVKYQMSDIPFDFDAVSEAMEIAMLEKKPLIVGEDTINHDNALKLLRDYFMTKRSERARAIAERRAEADSIAVAEGREPEPVEPGFADPDMFESEQERTLISYAFGTDLGANLLRSNFLEPIQVVWLKKGLGDFRDGKAEMTVDEVQNFMREYFTVKVPAVNKAKSEKWLADVAKKAEKTESGLLYKISKKGDTSNMPTDDRDVVEVHYKGTLSDGTVFDASHFADLPKERQEMMKQYRPNDYDKDEPAKFQLNRVIKGWTEGLKLIGVGGKITLWLPSELAYGEYGGGSIGPNQALRFDVELISVEPFEKPAPEPQAEEPAAETDEAAE